MVDFAEPGDDLIVLVVFGLSFISTQIIGVKAQKSSVRLWKVDAAKVQADQSVSGSIDETSCCTMVL